MSRSFRAWREIPPREGLSCANYYGVLPSPLSRPPRPPGDYYYGVAYGRAGRLYEKSHCFLNVARRGAARRIYAAQFHFVALTVTCYVFACYVLPLVVSAGSRSSAIDRDAATLRLVQSPRLSRGTRYI